MQAYFTVIKNEIENIKAYFATKSEVIRWTVGVGVTAVLAIAGLVTYFDTRMDNRVTQLDTRLSQEMKEMRQDSKEMRTSIIALAKKVDKLSDKVDALSNKVDHLSDKVDRVLP